MQSEQVKNPQNYDKIQVVKTREDSLGQKTTTIGSFPLCEKHG